MTVVRGNKFIFLAPVAVAISSMVLFLLALVGGWFGPAGVVAGEFCEASRPGLIKQPYNTWSNISFILSGILIGWQLMSGHYDANANSMTRRPFYAVFYASIVVLLGPGSMCMHATTSDLGGFFDMLSMYIVASFTWAYALERFFRLRSLHFAGLFTLFLFFCIWADGREDIHIGFDFFGDTVFAVLIGLTVITEVLNRYVRGMHHDIRWALAAFGALMLAFLIWTISGTGTSLCDPYSPLQGHAAWHILCAVSTYFLFRFYASEHTEVHSISA